MKFFNSAALVAALALASGAHAATQYTYDNLNRLTQVVYDNGSSIHYSYDAAGNLLSAVKAAILNESTLAGWWTFDDCTAADHSGYGNHGTLVGAVTCEAGLAGQALRFAGGTVNVPASDSLRMDGQVTLSVLVRLDSNNIDGAGLLQKGLSNTNWDYGMSVYAHAPAYRNSNSDWLMIPAAPNYSGAYHLFTAVVDEADTTQPVRLYVDGVALPGQMKSYNGLFDPLQFRIAMISPSALPLQMGIGHPGFPLKGALDDVRIYAKALSVQEVAALAREFGLKP